MAIGKQTMKNKPRFRTFIPSSLSGDYASFRRFPGLWYLMVFVFCLIALPLPGQAPQLPPVSATITFANGGSITIASNDQQIFSSVDILSGEAPNIQLQLPSSFVNTPVGIEPLDGGFAPDELQVAQDGSAGFVFQAGAQPGLYRIVLATAHTSVLLQFTVPNPGNP
jgi:hypothetical protein